MQNLPSLVACLTAWCAVQTPYLEFIWQLMKGYPMRPLVLLECRHISLSLCTRAVTPDVVAAALVEVMRRNCWPRAAYVGHSYGTFVLSRIVQMHRHLVESMVRACKAAAEKRVYRRRVHVCEWDGACCAHALLLWGALPLGAFVSS